MYQRMLEICSPPKRASGPAIDSKTFCTNPVLQEECLNHLTIGSRKKISHYVSELMDGLGYSYEMIKYRQQMRYSSDKAFNRLTDMITIPTMKSVTTGGMAEGTTLYSESDIDFMCEIQNVICSDIPIRFINQENLTLFFAERSQTSPGYTKLKMLRLRDNFAEIQIRRSLFEAENRTYYLSSRLFTESVYSLQRRVSSMPTNLNIKVLDISGPSSPTYSDLGSIDSVFGFTCVCPDLLENWVSRRRLHGWPSPDIIHEVSLLDGHVVPVGCKGSEEMNIEWRICFTLAELLLIRNFNEIQLKVYILLKKICKSVLKPVCKDMTSYIMKNVVFWISEEKGIQQFTRNLLMDRLFDCVMYIRASVVKNSLPNYMIPERNLFAGRLGIPQRHQLTTLLGNLLQEEGRMFLRCDQLRNAMVALYITPGMFQEFNEKRDTIERLILLEDILDLEISRLDMLQEEHDRLFLLDKCRCDIIVRKDSLMQFDRVLLFLTGKTSKEIKKLFLTRLRLILS